MAATPVRFGIIGCGLMGCEFASAAARWFHLNGGIPAPVVVAVCDVNQQNLDWFRSVPGVQYFYNDYRELLACGEVEAVYCSLPHNLHAQVYADTLDTGKHLLGEKPFGIDEQANGLILDAVRRNPGAFVRCTSEFPYFPAAQQLVRWHAEGRFGRIIEARFSIRHSSDMDLSKPINWKRRVETNGEYGCMGDLGIHTQHIPFRLGFVPRSVYAMPTKLVAQRPDGHGGMAPCDTFDNAVLLCRTVDGQGSEFPVVYEMKRMAPGCTNCVQYEIYGMDMSAVFTTDDPNAIRYTVQNGREQAWARLVIGQKTAFPVITGSIFEFGFSDSLLQMMAAFTSELRGLPVPFGCFTPEETALSHRLLTAALLSHRENRVVEL